MTCGIRESEIEVQKSSQSLLRPRTSSRYPSSTGLPQLACPSTSSAYSLGNEKKRFTHA